ncbi:MAG: hypothetical protein K0U37_04240 [Gammaproteobacteria bacterium]|nr:hypothetical protein [Gammaproteobacteria bacterium]
MGDLNTLLKPTWGAEKWILEGWEALNKDEQAIVTKRMDTLFENGLPFELKHDRILYIHSFSLLAQLEVLAIQVPLKFEAKMPTAEFKQRMRTQLVDEVFHGMVFTRILYELITPYALPPTYNEEVEAFCNFIREEDCPKVAVVLLNLVAEAWIEELFRAYHKADIAPAVFSMILEDEHRHVCEADLYREIGLPARDVLESKLALLEDKLLSSLLFNYSYMGAMMALLGMNGVEHYLAILDEKHKHQLSKLNLAPGKAWHFWMESRAFLFPQFKRYAEQNQTLELSAIRKVFMTQWKDPSDPTMVGEFDINVSRLDVFKDKNNSELLTMLMLQTLSQSITDNSFFRRYLSHHKLYRSHQAQTALVVKLPGCDDHLSAILFENCHELSLKSLTKKVIRNRKLMTYCYQRRLALEQTYPALAVSMDETMRDIASGVYPYPMPGNPAVSLSSVASVGYSRAKSPLRVNETTKFTLLTVQRKPVWNEASQAFEPEDSLPVTVSADHRVFDGMVPIPEAVKKAFGEVVEKNFVHQAGRKEKVVSERLIIKLMETLIEVQPKAAYKLLVALQTVWPDFIDFSDWIQGYMQVESKHAQALNTEIK